MTVTLQPERYCSLVVQVKAHRRLSLDLNVLPLDLCTEPSQTFVKHHVMVLYEAV